MKVLMCDFCGKILEDTPEVMAYDVVVSNAEDFVAESKEERALLFSAEHVCSDCARRVHEALTTLRRELKRNERQENKARRTK